MLGRSELHWHFSIFNKDDCDILRYFWEIQENVVLSSIRNDLNHMFPRNICDYYSHHSLKLENANVVQIN